MNTGISSLLLKTGTDIIPQSGAGFKPETIAGYAFLPESARQFIHSAILLYQPTFSEARLLTEAAVDLHQWGSLSADQLAKQLQSQPDHQHKKFIPQFLRAVENQRAAAPRYGAAGQIPEKKSPGTVVSHIRENKVFGMCPVASEKTVCCNLRTIDAVTDCALGCNYCAIQTMFSSDHVAVDANLAEKLRSIQLDKHRFYHFGTGQSSDSLLTGNRSGILDALMEFCRANENVFLEFKSKSSNIAYFEDKFQAGRKSAATQHVLQLVSESAGFYRRRRATHRAAIPTTAGSEEDGRNGFQGRFSFSPDRLFL